MRNNMNTINFWPILVAAVAAFGIGALWYSPALFGGEWMKLSKMSEADIAATRQGGIWKAYLAQFAAILVCYSVLGFLIASSVTMSAAEGAFLALLVWIGFIATETVGALLWERKPLKLIMISLAGTLISMVVGGAIIGAWH